jgi:hypothetical protein
MPILNACRKVRRLLFYPFLLLPFHISHIQPGIGYPACKPILPIKDIVVEGQQEWDSLEAQIKNLRDNLQTMRTQMKKARSRKDSIQRWNLDYRIDRLTAVLDNLKTLAASKQRYAVRNESRNGISYTTYDSSKHAIVFHIGIMNVPAFVHEATHGGQFEKGEMIFNKGDGGWGIGDDINDELEAYKNQIAFQFSSMDLNICETVTATWLFGLKDSIGHYVYNVRPAYAGDKNSIIGLIPIDIRSGPDLLKRAFPMLDTVWKMEYPLQDTNYFYFKKGSP